MKRKRRRRRRRTYPVTPPMAPNPTERAETRALFHWPRFCLVSLWLICKNCRGDGRRERKRDIPRTLFACHVKIQGPFAVEGIAAKNTPKYLTPTFWTKPMRQRPNTCKKKFFRQYCPLIKQKKGKEKQKHTNPHSDTIPQNKRRSHSPLIRIIRFNPRHTRGGQIWWSDQTLRDGSAQAHSFVED